MFSWYKCLIVGLVFSRLDFWSGGLFLIAPFPDLCLLVLFYMEHPYEEEMKVHIIDPGHMAKMVTMAINNKNHCKIFFSRTRRPVILKLGMKHQGIKLYKMYINHDHGMIFTYFTA